MLTKKDKHLATAQKYLERGQQERALEEFARVAEGDPADTRTWLKMAEIHARRGASDEAREIYLRTAEIYSAQGFWAKAVTVYRSVLKLAPGLPLVRVRLGEAYRQLGSITDALRELDAAADELVRAGDDAGALPALRRIVELHPDNVVSRIKLAETASRTGAVDEAARELAHAAAQLKHEGRDDEYVRVAERLLYHRPGDVATARSLAASYIARKTPRLALAKLAGALKIAPRDPENVALFAEALAALDPAKAVSVWRELAEIHAEAHREDARDAAVRAALALDPGDAEARELAARWGLPVASPHLPFPDGGRPPTGNGARRTGASVSDAAVAPAAPALDVPRILSEADLFVKYGLGERAIDHLRRVFTQHPAHRQTRERLAAVLAQLGRPRDAATELATLADQLAAARDADAAAVAARALVLDPTCEAAIRLTGKPDEADDHLRARLAEVDELVQQELFEDARAALAELDARYPRDPMIADKRRVVASGLAPRSGIIGEDEGAIPTDSSTPGPTPLPAPRARLSPSEAADPATHSDLGIAYQQMGLYDDAIAEFKQVAVDRRRAVFALMMIGECIEAKGELGEAVARYKEALNMPQVTPAESLALYYMLGAVFERLGDVREALYFFEHVHKRDPRFRDVAQQIARLKPHNLRRA